MATYYFGVNNGAGSNGGFVSESASTTGKDVELVINTTANVPAKVQLILAAQKLYDYIVTSTKNW